MLTMTKTVLIAAQTFSINIGNSLRRMLNHITNVNAVENGGRRHPHITYFSDGKVWGKNTIRQASARSRLRKLDSQSPRIFAVPLLFPPFFRPQRIKVGFERKIDLVAATGQTVSTK
jgi:hypothetical protein